jgi:hypothetical protein
VSGPVLVRATACPQWSELREKFSVVVTALLPADPAAIVQTGFPSGIGEVGYLGRVVSGEDMTLEDAFMFHSTAVLMRDANGVNAKFAAGFYPSYSCGVSRIVLSPSSWIAMYRLADAPEIVSKTLRESLIKAWDMRDSIRSRALSIATP